MRLHTLQIKCMFNTSLPVKLISTTKLKGNETTCICLLQALFKESCLCLLKRNIANLLKFVYKTVVILLFVYQNAKYVLTANIIALVQELKVGNIFSYIFRSKERSKIF